MPTWRAATLNVLAEPSPTRSAISATLASIHQAVEAAGAIDVLVNNAGIGLMGALEGTSMDTVRNVFETNVFGTRAMTRAVLPQFRQRRAGVVINVSSSTTLKPLPLLSVYTASKAAVNACTESLALELVHCDVRTHLVLPGEAPGTPFSENAKPQMQSSIPDAYATFAQGAFAAREPSPDVTHAADVAEAIWRAATDPACPLRVPAGADAVELAH